MKTKEKILELRKKNKSYNEICGILNISKATVSYHCKSMGINEPINKKSVKLSDDIINKMRVYYKTHTLQETSDNFNVGLSSVIKYCDKKIGLEKLTDEQKRLKNYDRVKKHRIKLKEKAVEYLGGKCIKCGYNKCIWSLDFHHRNPNEKDFAIGKYSYLKWDLIIKELDKCDLLCANCHRETHYDLEYNK